MSEVNIYKDIAKKQESKNVLSYKYEKRNGNGQSTCHLCNRLSWDSWCYNFSIFVTNKLLCKTVLCEECIQEIKNIEREVK